MNETNKAKIARFLQDTVMSEAVKSVLLQSFLKSRTHKDVQTLAASRLAIDFLEEAWRDLNKYKLDVGSVDKPSAQIGL